MAQSFIVSRSNPAEPLHAEIDFRVSREEFLRADRKWLVFKNSARPNLATLPDHDAWQWEQKFAQTTSADHGFVSLKFDGQIEGLAMFALKPVAGRTLETLNRPTLYVEYLETAPWNQKIYAGSDTRFWGVGTALIAALVEQSHTLQWKGRLALHSLASAKKFYLDQGFQNLGFDSSEGFDYFELTGSDFAIR